MALVKWLSGLLGLSLTIAAGVVVALYYGLTQPLNLDSETTYEIQPGYTSTRIGTQMTNRGWIYHPVLVRVAARLNPQWVPKVGEYKLIPGMTILDALAVFDSGMAISYKVTLVEGKTTQDYLQALEAKGNITMTLLGQSNTEIARTLQLPYDNAEGVFFADTYLYTNGETDVEILLRAHQQLQNELDRLWQQRLPTRHLTSAYEALILASIIEKETGVAYERPLISKVFYNRLDRNIRLQTDPTVIYGLGDAFDGNLTRQHLRMDTPYNTYRILGLPPTPIANVGAAAIEAAVRPGETDALYFVAKGDGTHIFSRTLPEHNAAVAKYQKNQRRVDYRSSPPQPK